MRHLKHVGHMLATYTTKPTASSSSTHDGGAPLAVENERLRRPAPEKNGRELTLTPCSSSRLVEQQLTGDARGQPAPEASTVAASMRAGGRYAGQRGHFASIAVRAELLESKEREVRVDRNNATCGQEISHVASATACPIFTTLSDIMLIALPIIYKSATLKAIHVNHLR
jgi:hypothetical protein